MTLMPPIRLAAVLLPLFVTVASAQDSIADVAAKASRAVAHVRVAFETDHGPVRVERSSSGFVVDPRGLLVTNEHLVDEIPTGGGEPGGEYWLAVLIGGVRPCNAKVVARDERLDLALLQLELEEGELIPYVELSADRAVAPGADAFGIGRPNGTQHFSLAGVVATPNGPFLLRDATIEPHEALVTDAAVLTDVDGGPYLDFSGVALGILNTRERKTHDASTDEEEVKKKAEPDYAVIVRSTAILGAFAEQLGAREVKDNVRGEDGVSAKAVEAATKAVVSVWKGDWEARPERAEPRDPSAQHPHEGIGSGVVIDPTGLVLTSSDVVGESGDVDVLTLDGARYPGTVLAARVSQKVALVQLALPEGTRLQALELGSSGAALAGECITVVGNPYGRNATVSAGVLSALEVEDRIRIGTWLHDGHKGGAVLDSTGRMIGMPVADIFEGDDKRARAESYLGVAVPVDKVRKWFEEQLASRTDAPSLIAAPAASEAEIALRSSRVTDIVLAMQESLLNVEIKAEMRRGSGFDPFATPGDLRMLGQGSGVVIDTSGLAITNWHVVDATLGDDGAQRSDHRLEVSLPSGKRYGARVLATSRDDDLALIQLELSEGDVVHPVELGATRGMRRGDWVVAIGNPYGKANTVTLGVVAALNQNANISGRLHVYENLLQTDAAINPGNSGGALLDLDGKLVGINSAGRSGAGLAIPVERVREVFGQKLMATMGPYVGFTVEDASGGLRISGVDESSPAAMAGVRKDDRLTAIDGKPLAGSLEFGNLLLARRPDQLMQLSLTRNGEALDVELLPMSHTAWRIFRQTGIEVAEIEYASEAARVREASVALHRAYTNLSDAEPSRLMGGALRVVRVEQREGRTLDVRAGDLLLGASASVRTVDMEGAKLVRFENVIALRDHLEPLATREGGVAECWLMRDGEVKTVRVPVVKVR